MDLLKMLRTLGDRLGILELSKTPQPSAPAKVQTRTVTLSELIMTIRITNIRDLADLPSELTIPFQEVFTAAGITAPPGGWTVDRLLEFLNTDRIRKMDRAGAQRETLGKLAAEKIDAAEIVKDVISRDQALDAFEEFVIKKRQLWQTEKRQLLEELQQQQRRVEKEIETEQKKWTEWRRLKRQREIDMARAVGYLIEQPVISIDEEEL